MPYFLSRSDTRILKRSLASECDGYRNSVENFACILTKGKHKSPAVPQHMCLLPGAQARTSDFMAMLRLTGSINRLLWNRSSSDKIANECDLRTRSELSG
jgi:hypothetical protein